MCYPGTKVSIIQTPQDIRDQIKRVRKSRISLMRFCEQCEDVKDRKEVMQLVKDGAETLADLERAIPAAERLAREKRRIHKQMLAKAEAERELERKEKIEMAKKTKKAKKAAKKVAAPVKKEKGKKGKKAAAKKAPQSGKKETYQDSILAVLDGGGDMPYGAIMKAVIDRRVEANIMTRPTGPNGACGAALKKMVVAGVLAQPTRGVYAAAKA